MKTLLIVFLAILCAVGISIMYRKALGFSSQRPSDYEGSGPELSLERLLSGPILAEGVIYGPTGRVVSRFVANMEGEWDGETGQLIENFRYMSGEKQTRHWTFVKSGERGFTATAPDVIGVGQGEYNGATMVMRYRIKLAEDAGGHVLDVVDWLYLLDNGTIMNRSEMRKYGVKAAELIATMRPAAAAGSLYSGASQEAAE